jgi:hypothetical protein
MRRFISRSVVAATLFAVAAVALGARCVENTNVYVDDEGYTHLTGEMFNDTDVQGVGMMVRGTLYDGAGNVIAEKESPICPPDLQPNSRVMFDIRFDNPGIPSPTSWTVKVSGGKALEQPLPAADVVVLRTDAIRFIGFPPIPGFPDPDELVFFEYDVRNRSSQPYTLQACSAAYNNQGKIVATDAGEIVQFDENGNPEPGVLGNQFRTSVFHLIEGVPPDAAYIRSWLWFGPRGATTSQYQFVSTPAITIQTDTFP